MLNLDFTKNEMVDNWLVAGRLKKENTENSLAKLKKMEDTKFIQIVFQEE